MPVSESTYCSSSPVPSVATTSAWVSPRVNSAEPWVRGRTPTSETILRTVLRSRPSMREPVSRMFQRTTLAWSSLKTVPICSEAYFASSPPVLHHGAMRLGHIMAIAGGDAGAGVRAPDRAPGERERGRGGDARRNVRIVLEVTLSDGDDDLGAVLVAVREDRADRPVN